MIKIYSYKTRIDACEKYHPAELRLNAPMRTLSIPGGYGSADILIPEGVVFLV